MLDYNDNFEVISLSIVMFVGLLLFIAPTFRYIKVGSPGGFGYILAVLGFSMTSAPVFASLDVQLNSGGLIIKTQRQLKQEVAVVAEKRGELLGELAMSISQTTAQIEAVQEQASNLSPVGLPGVLPQGGVWEPPIELRAPGLPPPVILGNSANIEKPLSQLEEISKRLESYQPLIEETLSESPLN